MKQTMPSTRRRSERLTGLIPQLSPVSRSRHRLPVRRRSIWKGLWLREDGQVTILVGILATALLSMVALVVDVGATYDTRRNLQNGTDAAALAGVFEIAEGGSATDADTIARQYVNGNVDGADVVTITFPENNKVKVEVEKSQQTFFAKLFGLDSVPVQADATAETGLAASANKLLPFIVPEQRVAAHIGLGNEAVFELGEDRPLEALSIMYEINGSQVTYTVTYVNSGSSSEDVEMWSPIPGGATYVNGSATGGSTFDGTDVRWSWQDVAGGDNRTADYIVDFAGPVDPTNEVFAQINGSSPTLNSGTSGPQLGFFWLSDFDGGSGGTPDFADWIINGYSDSVTIGMQASGTGVRASMTSAMDERIANDPNVVLPLYDYTEGGGHGGDYHVVGFAEFVITSFTFTGNPKHVTGYFTNGTVTPGAGGGSPVDYGVKAIWLSE